MTLWYWWAHSPNKWNNIKVENLSNKTWSLKKKASGLGFSPLGSFHRKAWTVIIFSETLKQPHIKTWWALAGWLSWLECHPIHQKGRRVDPHSGTTPRLQVKSPVSGLVNVREVTDQYFPPCLSQALKAIKTNPQVSIKKRESSGPHSAQSFRITCTPQNPGYLELGLKVFYFSFC